MSSCGKQVQRVCNLSNSHAWAMDHRIKCRHGQLLVTLMSNWSSYALTIDQYIHEQLIITLMSNWASHHWTIDRYTHEQLINIPLNNWSSYHWAIDHHIPMSIWSCLTWSTNWCTRELYYNTVCLQLSLHVRLQRWCAWSQITSVYTRPTDRNHRWQPLARSPTSEQQRTIDKTLIGKKRKFELSIRLAGLQQLLNFFGHLDVPHPAHHPRQPSITDCTQPLSRSQYNCLQYTYAVS